MRHSIARGLRIRMASTQPYWMVADMDGTVLKKAGWHNGTYTAPHMSDGPCGTVMQRWLALGGRVLMVTSDDGNAPIRKLWECVPPSLRANGAMLLSTSDGAALWQDDDAGSITIDMEYAQSATAAAAAATKAADGGTAGGAAGVGIVAAGTGIPLSAMRETYAIARDMFLHLFRDMLAERRAARASQAASQARGARAGPTRAEGDDAKGGGGALQHPSVDSVDDPDSVDEPDSSVERLLPQLSEVYQRAYGAILDRVLAGESTLPDELSDANLREFGRISRGRYWNLPARNSTTAPTLTSHLACSP